MNITRLHLYTPDISNTASFYKDILGLELISSHTHTLALQAGQTELVFTQSNNIKPVYHFAFTIPSNKLDEALQYMEGKVEIIEISPGQTIADFSNWNAKSFYFLDINGNVLEFIVRYDVNNDTEEPFSGKQICCISEIGLVTDNVSVLSDYLKNMYGLTNFQKQPELDNFNVLGDDHGLLILSAKGRHWYPTDIEAETFPVEVFFTDGREKEQRLRFDMKDASF